MVKKAWSMSVNAKQYSCQPYLNNCAICTINTTTFSEWMQNGSAKSPAKNSQYEQREIIQQNYIAFWKNLYVMFLKFCVVCDRDLGKGLPFILIPTDSPRNVPDHLHYFSALFYLVTTPKMYFTVTDYIEIHNVHSELWIHRNNLTY